jgi:uncharacterized protein (TIGR01732 family)
VEVDAEPLRRQFLDLGRDRGLAFDLDAEPHDLLVVQRTRTLGALLVVAHQVFERRPTERIEVLGSLTPNPEQRAEIEAEVERELARIEASKGNLASVRAEVEGELKAFNVPPAAQAEFDALLQKVKDGSLNLPDAIAELKAKAALGDGAGGYGGAFVLILVLFILLVIIGAGFGSGDAATANE